MYFEELNFKNENYSVNPPEYGEYESCVFTSCNFTNSNLSDFSFTDCQFINCEFNLTKLNGTKFKDVLFKECRLLGLRFDSCSNFIISFTFEKCILNYSSFYNLKIRKTEFTNCNLEGTDFGSTDLTSSSFNNCSLSQAIFQNTILDQVDFRTASGFSIDPEQNKMNKTKFSHNNLSGLLTKYNLKIE